MVFQLQKDYFCPKLKCGQICYKEYEIDHLVHSFPQDLQGSIAKRIAANNTGNEARRDKKRTPASIFLEMQFSIRLQYAIRI
jgi:hypothetical protein